MKTLMGIRQNKCTYPSHVSQKSFVESRALEIDCRNQATAKRQNAALRIDFDIGSLSFSRFAAYPECYIDIPFLANIEY